MTVVRNPPTKTPTKTAAAKAQAVAPEEVKVALPPAKKAVAKTADKASKKVLLAGSPEPKEGAGNKRKRLSKAFPRPLDKKLKRNAVVRDCFTFPEAEYAHLVALKKRLLADGVEIKKSELLRAGLVLLSSLDDEDMKVLLAKVPRIG